MDRIYNIYINSTNKNNGDTNYDYKLYFSNYNILIKPEEECYIYLKTFQTINTSYNINSKSQKFTLITKDNTTLIEIPIDYTIDIGNYNCFQFMDAINNSCSGALSMTYNEKQNTFTYTQNPALVGKTVYIVCNNYNYKYFGLPPNVKNSIFNFVVSSIINMNYFSLLIIKLFGIISNNISIDNFNNNLLSSSDIFSIINRQDTNINALINYTDMNNTCMFKIDNFNSDYLNFIFYNENNNILNDLSDWLMVLQIHIKKKST